MRRCGAVYERLPSSNSKDATRGIIRLPAIDISRIGCAHPCYKRSVIWTGRPALPLRPYVRYYYQVTDKLSARTELQPVPARSLQIIEFMFGTSYRVHRLASGERPVAPKLAGEFAGSHFGHGLPLGLSIKIPRILCVSQKSRKTCN